ncbi:hypothetical protein JCM9279_001302 [Rhodotorula babjevae]
MFDPLRRLVSGRKARLEDDDFSLDLVQLTERIIIMGFPAEGTAALYRNPRPDVQRYLSRHEGHFRIFNLCPRCENSYDAAHFGGEVRRFPWPDHHPPPLSLVPLMVAEARSWYEQDERNVVVVHCKAGKGRSGTFALSLLLALPGLPSAPALSSGNDISSPTSTKSDKDAEYGPLDPRAVLGRSSGDISSLSLQDKLEYLLRFHTLRRMAPGAKSYGVSIASQRRLLGYWARLLDGDDPRRAAAGAGGRKVVLEYVKVSGKGVSGLGKLAAGGSDRIAVQVHRYKNSIEASLRAKELALSSTAPPERFDDSAWDDRDDMIVHAGGLVESSSPPPSTAASPSSGTPARAASPPRADADAPLGSRTSTASASTASLPTLVRATPASSVSGASDDDEASLPPPSGTHAQVESEPPAAPPRERVLVPLAAFLAPDSDERRSRDEARQAVEREGGIVLDAEREVQLRFLVGKTGDKHAKLSAMAALALTWFVPVFEVEGAEAGKQSKLVIKGKDLDFRKPFAGIDEVEIGLRWL